MIHGHDSWWRSLAEYADTPSFRAWAEREFPALVPELDRPGASRRSFLKLVGASIALAGLGGCRREDHRVLPYDAKPAEIVPGRPLYYATTFVLAGEPLGVLAETHEGRPTKLEGNPLHPASRGALPALAQASILDLYDPDRSRVPLRRGAPVSWEKDFLPAFDALAERLRGRSGRGLAILAGRTASPSVDRLRERLGATMPEATWHEFEPLDPRPLPYEAELDLEGAGVIVSLDADLLLAEDRGVRNQRAFARGRDPEGRMNRLYVVEPHLTVTGAAADHRLRASAHDVHHCALALAAAFGATDLPPHRAVAGTRWIDAVAADLRRAGRGGVVVAGRRQPPAVHALARFVNEALGSAHVRYRGRAARTGTVFDLAQRIRDDEVATLLVLDANPVHAAPRDLAFASLLRRVGTAIHLGPYRDETARECTWHLPMAHALESWGDARTGRWLSPVQPMIAPLHGGRTALELLARLARATGEEPVPEPFEVVRATFRALTGDADLDARWRRFLHEGVAELADDAAPEAPPLDAAATRARPDVQDADAFEVCFQPSASVLDGRFANNGWLQETPDPITKLVWDNAAVVSPATARRLGVGNGDLVEVAVGDRRLELPAFLLPGGAERSVQLALGYGREVGSLARHAGFDAYRVRITAGLGFAPARVRKTEGTHPLATTQEHWTIETHELVAGALRDRALVREGTLARWREEPDFARHMGLHVPAHGDIETRPAFTGEHQWGMAIDLNRCTGCNACAVACQAENNIPVVGKDEVIRGREMSWIRVDRYFRGADPEGDVDVAYQPMLCQHCENAPCETVCPVNATVHDDDGLNVMTYNRCIGTRYCSNNCPYKVRRFNFYDYNANTLREDADGTLFDGDPTPAPDRGWSRPRPLQGELDELLAMQKNPDVTVRMRGVMEKCTFCVQRIAAAKIRQKVAAGQTKAAKVPDGALATACQQACPSEAIVFGDVSDPDSRVSRLKADGRGYGVLDHLNTRPRTTYLARLRNPNPALAPEDGGGGEGRG